MLTFKPLFAGFLFVSATLTALARELPNKVTISQKIPQWVEVVEADVEQASPIGGIADGVYYLLSDQQAYPEEQREYKHFAVRLISAEGVEDYSSIIANIDPDFQTLVWHRLDIIRDGVRLDQLPTQDFRVSTNQNRDDLIYDNSLDCMAIIKGTKKGDIIDYAYSVEGRNPIEGDHYSHWFSLNYSVPIAHIFGRVLRNPESRPLKFQLHSETPIDLKIPEPVSINSKVDYRFDLKNVNAPHIDEDVPDTYNAYGYLQVSDWESWQEVSRWASKLYAYKNIDVSLPSELEAELVNWKTLPSEKEKALAALHWVQEEIRYVAIMIGPHNYQPYKIRQTLERGFGDCKDKTQLLCFLLTELGIEATPTLVNTSQRELLRQYLPSEASFNHVITQAQIDGKSYWLDPTNSSQGGPIEKLWLPNYGVGLKLTPETTGLTLVPGQGAQDSKSFVRETLSMQNYTDISLKVQSRYTGAEADYMRRYFEGSLLAEIEKDYINYYAQQFPGIKSDGPLSISDDPVRNIFKVEENYTVSNAWVADDDNPACHYLSSDPKLIGSSMFLSDTRIRTMPAKQSFPLNFTQIIEVILPDPGTFENENFEVKTPWFKYNKSIEAAGKKLTQRYTYKNLTPTVPAADYPQYAKKIDEAYKTLGYSITHTDSQQNAQIDETSPASPHIASYLSAALSTILGLIAAAWIATRKQSPPKPPVNPELDGIGGWLLLPTIGIVLTPFIYLYSIIEQKQYFDSSWISTFASSASDSYIPAFEPLILSEIGTNVFCLIISIMMAYVYFKKRAILPKLYVAFSIVTIFIVFFDGYLTNNQLLAAGYDKLQPDGTVFKAGLKAVVWGTYFCVSERVRSTFRQ